MEHSVQRVYGAKARMALMVPSTNTVAETEFWEMAPDGITIHTVSYTHLTLPTILLV